MAKKLTFGNAVLCEYVAQGANNKHVLVNVFSGNVVVAGAPADVPFGLYIEVNRPNPTEIFAPEFEVVLNGKPLFGLGMEGTTGPGSTITFIVQSFQTRITGPGTIEVFVKAAGYQRTLALKKEIAVGSIPAIPAFSQPLSLLAPPGAPAP